MLVSINKNNMILHNKSGKVEFYYTPQAHVALILIVLK